LNIKDVVSLRWPSLTEEIRFLIPQGVIVLQSPDGKRLYVPRTDDVPIATVAEIDPGRARLRRVGFVRDAFVRYLAFVGRGLALIALSKRWDVGVRRPNVPSNPSLEMVPPASRGPAAQM
jgi:hypothetical protein